MANTPNGHDCASFERSIIQSLLDLEHARVEAKKEVDLAEIRAEFEDAADARATRLREKEEIARALQSIAAIGLPILLTVLQEHHGENASGQAIDLNLPALGDGT